jgi:hypothetical protein
MTDPARTVTIARRYAGPPSSGNGGYTSGLLAAYAAGPGRPVTVTLRRPPPLETALTVDVGDGSARLVSDGVVVAEAGSGSLAADVVTAVAPDTARGAEAAYRGLSDHPFPGCFVCGTDRAAGDGLALRPGLVAPGRTACLWTPDPNLADEAGRVGPEFVWAALDCPGGWTSDLDERPLVLGRMTAITADHVTAGRTYTIVGQLLGEQGRKTTTATTAYDHDGQAVGRAEHVWIAVDPAAFG